MKREFIKPFLITCSIIWSALLTTQLVAAQNLDQAKFFECTAIDSGIDRLACFDEVATQSKNNAKLASAIKQQGKWEIREKTHPKTGVRQISLLLDADFGQSSDGENISMVIRCRADLTDMYIIWGDPLDAEKVPVIVKLGDKNVETELWERSKSLKTSFRDRPTHLLRQMMLHDKVVFQVKQNQTPVTAVFDITGLRKVLKPVREMCNWTHG